MGRKTPKQFARSVLNLTIMDVLDALIGYAAFYWTLFFMYDLQRGTFPVYLMNNLQNMFFGRPGPLGYGALGPYGESPWPPPEPDA